jgi:hypothetical protein
MPKSAPKGGLPTRPRKRVRHLPEKPPEDLELLRAHTSPFG